MTEILSTTTPGHADLLRTVLRLDAAASGLLGVVAAAGGAAGLLAAPLGTSAPWLVGVGLFLVVYALGLVALAAPTTIPRTGAWTVVIGNAAWVAASVVVALAGDLTVLGVVVVLVQAAAVALLAELQYTGLRRADGSQRPAR